MEKEGRNRGGEAAQGSEGTEDERGEGTPKPATPEAAAPAAAALPWIATRPGAGRKPRDARFRSAHGGSGSCERSGSGSRSRLGPVTRRRWKRTKANARTVYNMRNRRTYARPPAGFRPATSFRRSQCPQPRRAGRRDRREDGRSRTTCSASWKGAQLISIDPWLSDDPDAYIDRSNVSQDEFERYYHETKQRLAPYGDAERDLAADVRRGRAEGRRPTAWTSSTSTRGTTTSRCWRT